MTSPSPYGMFINEIITEWIGPRQMIVLQPAAFIDRSATCWTVKTGDVIDGASIPRVFWSMIGGPFEGSYRRGSVFHDVYCVNKERPSTRVHSMFRDAILADGTPILKAWLMYQAVRNFGPRWD